MYISFRLGEETNASLIKISVYNFISVPQAAYLHLYLSVCMCTHKWYVHKHYLSAMMHVYLIVACLLWHSYKFLLTMSWRCYFAIYKSENSQEFHMNSLMTINEQLADNNTAYTTGKWERKKYISKRMNCT